MNAATVTRNRTPCALLAVRLCCLPYWRLATGSAVFLLAVALAVPASADINYVNQFGSFGSGNGQFDYAAGVTVGPTGNVYVVNDGGTWRVQYAIRSVMMRMLGRGG